MISGKEEKGRRGVKGKRGRGEKGKRRKGEKEKRGKGKKELGLKKNSFGELKITAYFCTPQTEAILIIKE